VKLFNYCSSIIAWNDGNGKFTIQKLPVMIQLSSVNAIRCTDIDGDGMPDLVLGGNEYGLLPQFGRLDASRGQILLNKGHRNFQYLDEDHSGLSLKGQIRDIQPIPGKNKKDRYVLFLINDDIPSLFSINNSIKN